MINLVPDAIASLKEWGIEGPFEYGLVLGTGLGPVAELIENPVIVPYAQLPGFPNGQVSGHSARVVAGRSGKSRVFAMQGRAHYYEHGDAAIMRTPVETMAALGIKNLILTNAAGSLLEDVPPGALALIGDHINLSGVNPLIGLTDDSRFVPMVDAYDPDMRQALRAAAAKAGIPLPEGIYHWFPGPSFETPAEIRMLRILGADAVGMSTVIEAIQARALGLDVVAFSCITNLAAGLNPNEIGHDEVLSTAATAAQSFSRLLARAFSL